MSDNFEGKILLGRHGHRMEEDIEIWKSAASF
jgi:hypothetical protein